MGQDLQKHQLSAGNETLTSKALWVRWKVTHGPDWPSLSPPESPRPVGITEHGRGVRMLTFPESYIPSQGQMVAPVGPNWEDGGGGL